MSRQSFSPRPSTLVRLALVGLVAGLGVGTAGCHWLWLHQEDDLEICDDDYDYCMANAWTPADQEWCEEQVRACYEGCEASWDEDDEADDQADDEQDDGESESSGESESGESESGESETGTDTDVPDECIELNANCLAQAESIADAQACELLYDYCIEPEECLDSPEGALEDCLDGYAACASAAETDEDVAICAAAFEVCTEPFGEVCGLADAPNLGVCLSIHDLCVSVAENDTHLLICHAVFESCMLL